MGSTPKISHHINGYSRYDYPCSVSFTATPGILYPAKIFFMNPREKLRLDVGAVIRTEAAVVPTFSPYQVRLHRFFVPMQLYHPEMRLNSSGFDFSNLTFNAIDLAVGGSEFPSKDPIVGDEGSFINPHSAMAHLRLASGQVPGTYSGSSRISFPVSRTNYATSTYYPASITSTQSFANADILLGYWDIVRNYYAYSQLETFSLAFPGFVSPGAAPSDLTPNSAIVIPRNDTQVWQQKMCSTIPLDEFFETQFYTRPSSSESTYADRRSLFNALWKSFSSADVEGIQTQTQVFAYFAPEDGRETEVNAAGFFVTNGPLAVIPSNPDRFSRSLAPGTASDDVSLTGVSNIRQLAFASRIQEYKDLLGAGGSRFTDWAMTFFDSKISHVDRPVLVYSSSFYLNATPVFNQSGEPGQGLGAYGGQIFGQNRFGKTRTYYTDEPGYLIDLISIRPEYTWSGVVEDYATYDKLDYFNPLFNEIGFQHRASSVFNSRYAMPTTVTATSVLREPCYNEFRAGYDEVLGSFAFIPGIPASSQPDKIYNAWAMQRRSFFEQDSYLNLLNAVANSHFVQIEDVNTPFAASTQDNFFINMYYTVSRKTLVSKKFATKLATR